MNNSLLSQLPTPLNTIVIEQQPGEYKDFHLSAESNYPLKGVTYASSYGYLPGYIGEDNVELDFFVGTEREGHMGYFTVLREDSNPSEHKFYIAMSDSELRDTLKEFAPVIQTNHEYQNFDELLSEVEQFKA